jgi:phage terminase large subunit GpA-like protein
MAIDVQRGSEKDEANPPRLELEVMGVCAGRISYSILYKSILGETDDPFAGAWAELNQWANETKLTFTRTDGIELMVQIIGIDSGDQSETVYRFCEQWTNTYPVKGFGTLIASEKRREKGDLPGGLKRYRAVKFGSSDTHVLEVNTAHYKNQLYNRLKIERQPSEQQRNCYCGFPRDYPDEYFNMLCGEEKRIDGSFHPIRARVEALDVRVYNYALEDFFLEAQVTSWRAYYSAQGWNALQVQSITTLWVLDVLAKNPKLCLPAGYR